MTAITKAPFGVTKNGTPVEVYTMENETLRVKILTLGGTIAAIEAPDKAGNMADICLGFDNVKTYEEHTCFFGALIGRYANRIGGARFTLNGEEYTLAKNDGANHLHGGPTGYHTKVWHARPQENSLVLTTTSADMEEGYPGNVKLEVVYTLDGNSLTIRYLAVSDKDTVINLTNHAYFNLAGHDSGTILDHVMKINADRFTRVGEGSIPTGELPDVSGTPFDLREGKRIGEQIDDENADLLTTSGYDHNFVLNGDGWKEAAFVTEETTGRTLAVYTDQPGVQFYAGNFITPGLIGKDGKEYVRRGGFCLETQVFPDTPNQPDFPTCLLKKGDIYAARTTFVFGVQE